MKSQMNKLVRELKQLAHGATLDDHHDICTILADKFQLYDAKNRFPLWLSFVVTGYLNNQYATKK